MIRVLSKQVSDKIAAGEVVERPVSIMKELVENSIDAGATRIVVEIKNGGKSYLRVTDNGCGIPADQVVLAFQRHATSKIREAEDLDQIHTLGFRGEALTSIAAVSRTEIITKDPSEKSGSRVLIEGGDIIEQSTTGCPDGTTIVVRDLFYNTPARLKFLKPDSTESGLIIEFVSQMALAYPEIRFRMINNEQSLFSTQGNGNRLESIHTLYGRINGGKLLEVESTAYDYRLEGYISDPGEHRSNRKSQIFFVNGRVINNKIIERALDKAYTQRLFDGRHPIAYLFLEIPAEELDVNIHPNKREVRFHKETEIEAFIWNALARVLQQPDAIPGLTGSGSRQTESIKKQMDNPDKAQNHHQMDINILLSTLRDKQNIIAEESISKAVKEIPSTTLLEHLPDAEPLMDHRFHPESLNALGIAFGTYIIATDEDTLYLIDQHAAHERILFEQILDQMNRHEKVRQTIMLPFTVRCSIAESSDAEDWLHVLSEMGYTLEPFGPSTYLVKEIPGFLTYEEAERFLSDFLDHVSDGLLFTDRKVLMKAASNACKAAVKGHEHLSNEEIDELLIRLSQCENPLSCPHGRPTFIRFPQSEIERKFRRI